MTVNTAEICFKCILATLATNCAFRRTRMSIVKTNSGLCVSNMELPLNFHIIILAILFSLQPFRIKQRMPFAPFQAQRTRGFVNLIPSGFKFRPSTYLRPEGLISASLVTSAPYRAHRRCGLQSAAGCYRCGKALPRPTSGLEQLL